MGSEAFCYSNSHQPHENPAAIAFGGGQLYAVDQVEVHKGDSV
jgi:hypothetical protein